MFDKGEIVSGETLNLQGVAKNNLSIDAFRDRVQIRIAIGSLDMDIALLLISLSVIIHYNSCVSECFFFFFFDPQSSRISDSPSAVSPHTGFIAAALEAGYSLQRMEYGVHLRTECLSVGKSSDGETLVQQRGREKQLV